MIPILYERDEIAFVSNGLGRLRDCISCVVTEERNGIFECDFDYPVDGANYELIELGRIIGVTYDESETIEPFDIVSFTKPIDGIVSFHAVHISYRLSAVTVTGKNINSLAAALSLLEQGTPSNPFTYYTDKTSSAYMAAADGTPRSVRQLLGGVEGSILDTYGGEYKFERFQVSLLTSRGEIKPFTVRYGVNLIEYNDDTDASGTFTSCIPYWTDGTTTVIGNKVTSSGVSFDGRERCVPYDLSEKFEMAPTKTQLQNLAAQEMNRLQSWLPAQTISVDFARLSDFSEFSSFESLYECNLCDSITVIFPDYGTSGVFKIVKTTWNVLSDRYDSMELGTLATTLGDLFSSSSSGGGAGGGNQEQKILWQGASVMGANETITLSESLLDQTNGIILVWSAYDNNAGANYNFASYYIPKIAISEYGGGLGWPFILRSGSNAIVKYVYIGGGSGIRIGGNALNSNTAQTFMGRTVNAASMCLRMVIGV